MKYLKIKEDLYIAQQEIFKKEDAVVTKGTVNHIWIFDRSGSMYYELKQLTEDLVRRSKMLPKDDTITLGWFSSQGRFNWIVKGYRITDDMSYTDLENAIRRNNTTIGLTCFSDILRDTLSVTEDLKMYGDVFSMCFFTDGYPVVSNYSREVEEINKAVKALEPVITSALFVGYSYYYNKELMTSMAEKIGGSLIHAEDLGSFNTSLDSFVMDSRENDNKIEVTLESPSTAGLTFGVNRSAINVYEESKGKVNFVPTKLKTDYLFTLVSEKPSGIEVTFDDKNTVSRTPSTEPMVKAAYAAAYLLTQKTKTDLALDILGVLGDKSLIDGVNKSFTATEYGNAEASIKTAMTSPLKRFSEGRDTSYLPSPDQFCLLDALDVLMADDDAKFSPYSSDFSYRKIGIPSKVRDGFPKFVPQKNVLCSLGELSWNKSKLNLSVRAMIHGTVPLNGSYKKQGFSKNYPTFIYRNYAIVKDGFLNVKTLPVVLSKTSFDKMKEEGVIDSGERFGKTKIFNLHLDRIPIINRSISDGKTSAVSLCKKVYEEINFKSQIKALKDMKDVILGGKTAKKFEGLTEDQNVFLKENGITPSGFNPPSDKGESIDHYFAKEFDIKVKGLSSIPKVAKVQEKLSKSKTLTISEELVKTGLDMFEKSGTSKMGDSVKVSWIDDKILELKREMLTTRTDIQKTKFAILVGKKWFDEFSSRENNVLDIDGNNFTISVREVRVDI